jgi:HAD superfamily hydrolase (TIGR01490 family)
VSAAAIFDLDRTLISGSSAPVFGRYLHEEGLGSSAGSSPVAETFFRAFELFGETWTTMQPARLFARTAKGWPVEAVERAAEAAADELLTKVLSFVRPLLDEHRAAGRRLVLATTSPDPLVRPLAGLLGFDDVVATKWSSVNGVYTGEVDGLFVWGRDKKEAVAQWATLNAVDLSESHAYSDSYFDAPLLGVVGYPTAVNPDPRLALLAPLRRWPVRFLDVSPGVIKIAGRELQDWVRPFNRPEFWPNATFEFLGIENIPKSGPGILVFNHRSYFDSVAVSLLVSRSGRTTRFLGKKEVFDAPVIGQMAKAFGGIRVVRASGSDEPLEAAAAALRAGELVAMAPQGTIPRGPAFFDPVLKGRWGAAKLAAMSGAPIIPVGLWGTEKVWPRNSRLPKFGGRPLVQVHVGEPLDLEQPTKRKGKRTEDSDTARIMAAIVDQLPDVARDTHVSARILRRRCQGSRSSTRNRRSERLVKSGADTLGTSAGPRPMHFESTMSDAEALMWNIEKDPWLNPSGATVTIVDRPIDVPQFRRRLAVAVADISRLHQRVEPGFGRLTPPAWVTDREFNLDHHVRHVSLPTPGTRRQLYDLATRLYEDPFDRTRPLWQFVVIDGLEGGKGALFMKLHHSISDGNGLVRISLSYMEMARKAPPPRNVDLDQVLADAAASEKPVSSDPVHALSGGMNSVLRRQVGVARRLAAGAMTLAADPLAAKDAGEDAIGSLKSAYGQLIGSGGEVSGGSPLWKARSRHRQLESLRLPVAGMKAVGAELGGSLNDVFVTGAVMGALRFHELRGVDVEALNVSFIVSTKTDQSSGANSFSPSRVQVLGAPMNPKERFAAVRALMVAGKADVKGAGALAGIAGIANLLPTSAVTRFARAQAAKMDFATSNLRAAPFAMYISGARVLESATMGPVAGTAFNLTAVSYDGSFDMGLFVDPVAVDDPTGLRDCMQQSFVELFAAGGVKKKTV